MDDLKQQAGRLKALWKSGRDKYASFFTVLGEVRKVVGDAKLADWCFEELRISLSVMMRYRELLSLSDDQMVRDNLAAANAADKKAREEAKFQAALEKARKAKELAEAKAEAARAMVASKKVQDAEKDRQRKRSSTTERGPVAGAKRRTREFTANLPNVDLGELAKRFEAADKMCADGLMKWVEGSIIKAVILATARAKYPDNAEFGAWLGLCSSAKTMEVATRAALIGLGRLGEPRLREILLNTESRSYRTIWEKNKLALVDDEEAVNQ